MKFSFQHRAFYCYLIMTLWILFLVTAVYRYMGLQTEEPSAMRRSPSRLPRGDARMRWLRSQHCHPPEEITRGTEGAPSEELWQLRGVLAVTRHGDRGPLTHLRGGDALPCNTVPASAALRNYSEYVWNASAGGRAPWVQAPGPFHNFPTLPVSSEATSCALGQLTLLGVQQMLATGEILKEAYGERLGWLNSAGADPTKESGGAGDVVAYSTRYRRTFQSALALLFALPPRAAFPARAAALRESHTVAFCFRECACARAARLQQRLSAEARARLESHPAVAALVAAVARVVLDAHERPDADVLRDALLASVCHRAPLPCADTAARAPRPAPHRDAGGAVRRNLLARSTRNVTNEDLSSITEARNQGDVARHITRGTNLAKDETSIKRTITEYTPIEAKLHSTRKIPNEDLPSITDWRNQGALARIITLETEKQNNETSMKRNISDKDTEYTTIEAKLRSTHNIRNEDFSSIIEARNQGDIVRTFRPETEQQNDETSMNKGISDKGMEHTPIEATLRSTHNITNGDLRETTKVRNPGDLARNITPEMEQQTDEISMKRSISDIDTEYTRIKSKFINFNDEVKNNDRHYSQSLQETPNNAKDKSWANEDLKEEASAPIDRVLGTLEKSTQETLNNREDLEDPTDKYTHLKNNVRQVMQRRLNEIDIDTLNLELDYINNQLDFNNEIGRKARDIIDKTEKARPPLDFDAQMEKEKLSYYKQRYMENADPNYDDVVVVKKHLDSDFNFNLEKENEFDEDTYQDVTPQDNSQRECVRQEQLTSLFAFVQWNRKLNSKSVNNKKKATLNAYGFIHNIVKNMIRMISEHKPKFVYYSGHDKTIQVLVTALGLSDYGHLSVYYASRMVFEVYRRAELRSKRKAVAQDFYFRTVLNGKDVTDQLSFCRGWHNVAVPTAVGKAFLCPIENIVRFIHDDYFAALNATNFKDACATH